MAICLSGLACSAQTSLPPAQTAPAHAEWLEKGRLLDASGQSVRAEQYFLAAEQAGADEEEVFSLLVDTCIESGRLGSALGYVEARLRRNPDSPLLRQLSASLHLALGHEFEAERDIRALEGLPELSASAHLFLANYYDRTTGEADSARRHFEAYVRGVPAEEVPLWVNAALRRLARGEQG